MKKPWWGMEEGAELISPVQKVKLWGVQLCPLNFSHVLICSLRVKVIIWEVRYQEQELSVAIPSVPKVKAFIYFLFLEQIFTWSSTCSYHHKDKLIHKQIKVVHFTCEQLSFHLIPSGNNWVIHNNIRPIVEIIGQDSKTSIILCRNT